MINFNSLWRNVAEHGFPEAGNWKSLAEKQCRSIMFDEKYPIVIIGIYHDGMLACRYSDNMVLPVDQKHIEYLNDSEEAFRDIIKEATKDLQYKLEKSEEDRLTSYSVGRAEAELDMSKELNDEISNIHWRRGKGLEAAANRLRKLVGMSELKFESI